MTITVSSSTIEELQEFIIRCWYGEQGKFARSIKPDLLLTAKHTEDDALVINFEVGQSYEESESVDKLSNFSSDVSTVATKVRGAIWFEIENTVKLAFTRTETTERTVKYEASFDLRDANINAPNYR